jgi:hypothetical protein
MVLLWLNVDNEHDEVRYEPGFIDGRRLENVELLDGAIETLTASRDALWRVENA